jgi:hypothetical protein
MRQREFNDRSLAPGSTLLWRKVLRDSNFLEEAQLMTLNYLSLFAFLFSQRRQEKFKLKIPEKIINDY